MFQSNSKNASLAKWRKNMGSMSGIVYLMSNGRWNCCSLDSGNAEDIQAGVLKVIKWERF